MPDPYRTAPYQQIAEDIRSQIRSGRVAPGDELLSIRLLAAHWNVATSTAQRAMDVLRDEGWVESRPGRPAVVAGSIPSASE